MMLVKLYYTYIGICKEFFLKTIAIVNFTKIQHSSQKNDVYPSFVDRTWNSGIKLSQILKKTGKLYLKIVDKTVIGGCMSVKNVYKKSFTGIDNIHTKCYGGV